jgi:transcriptional regulator with XRE-family HTH domain
MRDIANTLIWLERERLRRNRKIKKLRITGWTYSRIADKVGLTRQRIQQIIKWE